MKDDKANIVRRRYGFIAALDQSGGSSSGTLERYGISKDMYSSDEEMFNLIHEMRKRVFTSNVFNSNRILGAILFYNTMNSYVDGKLTSDYLWENKRIVSFLKIDQGLQEEIDGVKLMKPIENFSSILEEARSKGIFGTKERSVIYKANKEGIRKVVRQQFAFAKVVSDYGLVPIVEPEVDINAPDKALCEEMLHDAIKEEMNNWYQGHPIMFKFTIPEVNNLYFDLYYYPSVLRIVALSGGYPLDEACEKLSNNKKMIASFSRALLEGLNVNQTDTEFDEKLNETIDKIFRASIV